MTLGSKQLALAALLVAGTSGSALAFGGGSGGSSGSGLSPYAEQSGNDRSAGVNNGNYTPPQYNYYVRTYGRNRERVDGPRSAPPGSYGYPY